MGVSCPPGSICSDPYTARVGEKQTTLYFFTSTKVTQDSSGKVNGGTTTLYYSPTQNNYIPAATTSDGGKTWNYLKDNNDKFILGDDARKSLQEGALKTTTNNVAIPTAARDAKIPEQQAKTLQLNQNTASSNAQPESADAQTLAKNFKPPEISDGSVRQNYGNLQYPLKAKFTQQDCVMFTMYRYKPKKFAVKSDLGVFEGEIKGSTMGTVTLPIQPSISDSNGVSWGESQLNAVQAMAGAAAFAGITEGGKGFADALTEIIEGLKGKAKDDAAAGLAAAFAGEAVGNNQAFLTRATGAILNNNLELLFQGPSLRTFTFNFSLSARYKEEAEQIRKIIRFFKQGMSVKRSTSDLFLKTPNIFDIEYKHKNADHTYLNKIKTCALQNCSVNYTPAGNYATYDNGAMTQYDITLSFGEIEPIFDDDYTKLDKDQDIMIGY